VKTIVTPNERCCLTTKTNEQTYCQLTGVNYFALHALALVLLSPHETIQADMVLQLSLG